MMQTQLQPSRTSCGPACVAMLAGIPVADVIATLPAIRLSDRKRMRSHSTNYGELARLLQDRGIGLGRRMREPPPTMGRALLRIDHVRGRNWHWAVLDDGVVHDPARPLPQTLDDYAGRRVTWYDVDGWWPGR